MTNFWSGYIVVLTLTCLGLILWLLLATRKGQRKEQTEETLGHSFDGIEEFDNPLPRWWFVLFIATMVFGAIYLFLFPICIRLLMMTEQGLARSWALFEGSRESDGLPLLFLFKTLLPGFAVLMVAQGLSEALKAALRLTGKLEDAAEEDPHGGLHGA